MDKNIFWTAANELSGGLFKLFMALDALEDNEAGYCFATNKGIAEKLGLQADRVTRGLSDLKKKGYVKIIEIGKKGNYVEERRIYTVNNFSNHERDLANQANLQKTTYEVVEGIPTFYNELSPKPEKTRPTLGIGKKTDRGIGKKTDRGIGKNTDGTISNITNTKINRGVDKNNFQKPEPVGRGLKIWEGYKEDPNRVVNERQVLIGKVTKSLMMKKDYHTISQIETWTDKELKNYLKGA